MDKPSFVYTTYIRTTPDRLWQALTEHRILVQFSPSLDRYVFYPRTLAPGTLADDLQWREIDGAGTVYTFTVARRPTGPPWADAVPQILDVVCRLTGMGFAAVARVTEDRWIACAVRDEIAFGLTPGSELPPTVTCPTP